MRRKGKSEKNNLKMNEEKIKTRNKIIEEALREIEAEVDESLRDIQMPSDAELELRRKAMLYDMYKQTEEASSKIKAKKRHKRVGKVLAFAAIVTLLTLTFVTATVASKHNINIENGFVTYIGDVIRVTFFKEGEKYISLKSLTANLENNGYTEAIIPEYFEYSGYKATIPEYTDNGYGKQASFTLYNGEDEFRFNIAPIPLDYDKYETEHNFLELENAQTVRSGDMYIYIFEHNKGRNCRIDYSTDNYNFSINSRKDYETMIKIAETINEEDKN